MPSEMSSSPLLGSLCMFFTNLVMTVHRQPNNGRGWLALDHNNSAGRQARHVSHRKWVAPTRMKLNLETAEELPPPAKRDNGKAKADSASAAAD